MPLYEYQCDACGHRFEMIQKFSDPLLEKCPRCGGALTKLQSAPAFHLKGSGWYVTDYAKKDQAPAGKDDSASKESASEGKDAPKAEKMDKAEKSEKTEKTEKTEKSEKTTSSTDAKPSSGKSEGRSLKSEK
jgi:putative FmdB family regulatory protein